MYIKYKTGQCESSNLSWVLTQWWPSPFFYFNNYLQVGTKYNLAHVPLLPIQFLNESLSLRSLSSWGCVEATVLSTAPERYTVVQCTLMYSDVCLLTPVKREWAKQLLFLLDFLYSTRANFSFRPCAMHNWAKYFLNFFKGSVMLIPTSW